MVTDTLYITRLEQAASEGDLNAACQLGSLYRLGSGIMKDDEAAINWYIRAALAGSVSARSWVGTMMSQGRGCKKNCDFWHSKLTTMADNGDGAACCLIGIILREGWGCEKNYNLANVYFNKGAIDYNNLGCMNNLGLHYRNGFGFEQNYAKAIEWYRKAAEQGDATAQSNLGGMYEHGQGVKRDYSSALKWYSQSASQGNALAQCKLAFLFDTGCGIDKHHVMSLMWYRKAADQGDAGAQYALGVKYASGEGVRQDDAMAFEWYRKAAEQGDARAQYDLGVAYTNGKKVQEDYAKAVEWYRKAAEQGYSDAQTYLGYMYDMGRGVEKDDAVAVEWYRKSAEKGDGTARKNLMHKYSDGHGIVDNINFAYKFCEELSEKGDKNGQFNLAWMLTNGLGGTCDLKRAINLYTKAAEGGHQGSKTMIDLLSAYSMSKDNIIDFSSNTAYYNEVGVSGLNQPPEIQALFKKCTPVMYQQNIYNLLGLSINASEEDILERKQQFEEADRSNKWESMFHHIIKKQETPNRSTVFEAFRRIKDPVTRFIESFFWFWPMENELDDDTALRAILSGNIWGESDVKKYWNETNVALTEIQRFVVTHNLAIWFSINAFQNLLDNELKTDPNKLEPKMRYKGDLILQPTNRLNYSYHFLTTSNFFDANVLEAERTKHILWFSAVKMWTKVLKVNEDIFICSQKIIDVTNTWVRTEYLMNIKKYLPIGLATLHGRILIELAIHQWDTDFYDYSPVGRLDTDMKIHVGLMQNFVERPDLFDGILADLLFPYTVKILKVVEKNTSNLNKNDTRSDIDRGLFLTDVREYIYLLKGLLRKSNPVCAVICDYVAISVMERLSKSARAGIPFDQYYAPWKALQGYADTEIVKRILHVSLQKQLLELRDKCWFCSNHPSQKGHEVIVPLYQIGSVSSRGAEYMKREIQVPRCKNCFDAHSQYENWKPQKYSAFDKFFFWSCVDQSESDRPPLPKGIKNVITASSYPLIQLLCDEEKWKVGTGPTPEEIRLLQPSRYN